MNRVVITNVSTYREIAEDAYAEMVDLMSRQRAPKPDGTGWILQSDPSRKSFKNSIVTVVFAGMWIEAFLHLKIVGKFGEEKFKEYDRKSYEEKLTLLGVEDREFLAKVKSFRETRKELVHEKSFFDSGVVKLAQDEAEVAHGVMQRVVALLG